MFSRAGRRAAVLREETVLVRMTVIDKDKKTERDGKTIHSSTPSQEESEDKMTKIREARKIVQAKDSFTFFRSLDEYA